MKTTDNHGNAANKIGITRRELGLGAACMTIGFLVRPLFNNDPDSSIVRASQETESTQPLTLSQINASRSDRQVADDAAKRRDQYKRINHEYNMTERLAAQHPSGLAIKLFSDRDILVPGATSALSQAVSAGLTVLDKLPDGDYKSRMINFRRKAEKGVHSGNELEFYVSSRLDTIWSQSAPFDNMHADTVYRPLTEPSSNGVIHENGPYYMVAMNAAAIGGRSYASINGKTYENSPEEKLAREISHESLHAFERLEGITRNEPLALMIESLLEVEYSQGNVLRPLPFIFP